MTSSLLKITILSLVYFSSSACIRQKIKQRLSVHQINQSNDIWNLEHSVAHPKLSLISWDQAVSRIEKSNIRYKTSLNQVAQAKKSIKKTWWSLSPDIFTFLNISKNITEISDLGSQDISFSVASNINIPNPFIFYAQLYGNHLNVLRAEWQHELTRRNIQVQLFQLYSSTLSIKDSELHLAQRKQYLSGSNSSQLITELTSIQESELSIIRQKEFLRLELNDLFNTPGRNWLLTGRPPNISYSQKIDDLQFSKGFGKLALMLQAAQIEVALLSVWQVKFNRFPQLSVGVSTPPIFSSSAGNSSTFNSEEINLFSGVSKSFNIEDPLSLEKVSNTQTRSKFTRDQLKLTTESELSRFRSLKQQYRHLLQREANLKSLLLSSQNFNSSSEPEVLLKKLEQQQNLKRKLKGNQKVQQSIDLQFWVWDETYGKKFNS